MRTWIQFGLAATLAACSNNKPISDPGTGGTGGGVGGSGVGGSGVGGSGGDNNNGLALRWEPCPLITDGNPQDPTAQSSECATVEVPLDWDAPDGRKIELFVKRKRATVEPARGQIWMLAGGPGQPGAGFEGAVQAFAPSDPTLSFYLLDHRGVGRSSRLACPKQEALESEGANGITAAEWPQCLQHIKTEFSDEELAFFSTTQASHDLGKLIEATETDEAYVAIWGASYGSHWANRYLSLYPEQPELVLLSAIAAESKLSAIDAWMDRSGRRYLAACDADFCQDKFGAAFGDTAVHVAEATLAGPNASLCAPIAALGWTPENLKTVFGQFMYSWTNRTLVPPLIYRVARCNEADVNALTNFAIALSQPAPTPLPAQQRLWGTVLGRHIILSEMWDTRETAASLQNVADNALMMHGSPSIHMALYQDWPRYYEPNTALAVSKARVVMYHGEFDFIGNDVYQPVVDHFTDLAQQNTFTLVPRAPHGLTSPTKSGFNCGTAMLLQQLRDPAANPDSCSDEILPLDFVPVPQLASPLLGTSDAWEGDPGTSAAQRQLARAQPQQTTKATPDSASPAAARLFNELNKAMDHFRRLHPDQVARLRTAVHAQTR